MVRMKALDLQTICTFIFGNDDVVRNTSEAHPDTWNSVSGEMLGGRVGARASLKPFAREHDLMHADGERRCRLFASRGIGLPDGSPGDPTTGNEHGHANYRCRGDLERPDMPLFQDAHTRIGRLRCGIRGDVFPARRHAQWVLDSAQAACLFDCVVDIIDAAELSPFGKLGLATRDEAADRLRAGTGLSLQGRGPRGVDWRTGHFA